MSRPLIRMVIAGVLLAAPTAFASGPSAGTDLDTATYRVPEVVVTALRGQDRLRDIPAASFVISRQRIQQSGVSRLSSLLGTLPGLYGYQQNSSGDVLVVDPRGFTANGESSYLKLLVNGQDVRDVENGSVDWDWLLPHDVERIEVVEGPGAWLYGDGSEGGIVNIVCPPIQAGFHSDCGAQFGSFGLAAGSIVVSGQQGDLEGSLRGSGRRVLGWRDHSRDRVFAGGGEGRWTIDASTRISIDGAWIDAYRADPGALRPDQIALDRGQSDTRTDFNHPQRINLGGHLTHGRLEESEWTLSPYLRTESVNQVRTILYQTKAHPTQALTAGSELGWRRSLEVAGHAATLSATGQIEQARLTSKYFDFDDGVRGELRSDRLSWRTTVSGFLGALVTLDARSTARLGFRQDAIRVRSESLRDGFDTPQHTFWLASPFVALSRRFGNQTTIYGSYSSAFRVPTLNQLFDRRPFFNPFTFETVYLSNPGLAPQKSHGVELGARIDGPGGAYALLDLYSLRVRDEIDFDAATTSYANLSRSWHRGVQAAFQQPLGTQVTGTASATYSPTTIRGGPLDGHQINAVPRRQLYGGLRWTGSPLWSVEGGAHYVGPQFLDKASEHRLPAFSTVDLAGSVQVLRIRTTLRVGNLLDHKHSDSGYYVDLGPALQEERLYPAGGRNFTVSLTAD